MLRRPRPVKRFVARLEPLGQWTANATVAFADVNNDNIPDVVLTTDTHVGVLLGTAATGDDWQPLPVATSPFLPYVAFGGQAVIHDTRNISDGAAKGQASDRIIQNSQGGYDLVTEADGQFLLAPLKLGDSSGTTDVTFGQVKSIAVMPLGTSAAANATPIQPGGRPTNNMHIPVSDEVKRRATIFVTGMIDDGAGLVAVIGDTVYVGVDTSGTNTFTWHSFTLQSTKVDHGGSQWQEYAPGLFLADVNNDGNLDLFTVPADVAFLAGHRFWKFDVVSIVDENVFGA